MSKYVLTQVDGNDEIIAENHFNDIPTLEQFSDVAHYVDRSDIRLAYKELRSSEGDWIHVSVDDEDGCSRFYVDDGVWFLLEKEV